MSEEQAAVPENQAAAATVADAQPEASNPLAEVERWLPLGNSIGLVFLLLMTLILMFLVISLGNDVTRLEDQTRKATKSSKALQEEVASLKAVVQTPEPKPVVSITRVAPRPANIDAADPARDCVIRPGDKEGVANCLTSGVRP